MTDTTRHAGPGADDWRILDIVTTFPPSGPSPDGEPTISIDGPPADPAQLGGAAGQSVTPAREGSSRPGATGRTRSARPGTGTRGHLSRRSALGLGVGGVVLLGGGAAALAMRSDDPSLPAVVGDGSVPGGIDTSTRGKLCVPASSMTSYARVGRARLQYEVDHTVRPFPFQPAFHAQVERWLADFPRLTGFDTPTLIATFGAYVEGGSNCHSYHAAGRAFDIARLSAGDTIVSCREDIWSRYTGRRLAYHLNAYWRLAATLHLHFAYVLTHHFDPLHRNHIHIDNAVSESGMSRFDPQSRVQNQAVEAICTHLWGRHTPVTGAWDEATRASSRAVLRRLGRSGDLTTVANWRAFLKASAARG